MKIESSEIKDLHDLIRVTYAAMMACNMADAYSEGVKVNKLPVGFESQDSVYGWYYHILSALGVDHEATANNGELTLTDGWILS